MGLFLILCLIYFEVNGFGLMRLVVNFLWFFCFFEIKLNFEVVNLNLCFFFYCLDDDWFFVVFLILFIMVLFIIRELISVFLVIFKLLGKIKLLCEFRGNLG